MINIGWPDLLVPNRRTADNRVPPGIAGAFALIERMAARLKNQFRGSPPAIARQVSTNPAGRRI